MIRLLAATALTSVLAGSSEIQAMLSPHPAAPPATPVFRARALLTPRDLNVFAGARARFHLTLAGVDVPAASWSVVGAGTIDQQGDYAAPERAGEDANVVASVAGFAAAAAVHVVAPPSVTRPLAVISCYDDGSVDVRDANALSAVGTASIGSESAGIAVDARRRLAFVASGDRIAVLDLRTAQASSAQPVSGARFSEVVEVANEYVVATDNEAAAGHAGIRVFHLDAANRLTLRSSAAAGDTPEGIAVAPDERSFYVTNVNSNSVMRFAIGIDGRARLTRTAPTGHRPYGVAIDGARNLLFVADNDTATISGTASRPGLETFSLPSLRRIARLSTGTQSALPLGVVADAGANRLFVTNEGDGNVVAYSVAPFRRVASAPTGRTPWLPAVDPHLQRLYVPSAMGNSFSVLDERTLRPIGANIPTCGYPVSIAIL